MDKGYDVIGDVHACIDELFELMAKLGYAVDEQGSIPPDGRQLVFAGDLNDRGPDSAMVLDLVMDLVEAGMAIAIQGNHDNKLYRYLKEDLRGGQSKVRISHGLAQTLEQLDKRGFAFKQKVLRFLENMPTIFETEDLIVVHGAYLEHATGKEARDYHLYGMVDRKEGWDDQGFPKRLLDWQGMYTGTKTICVGHIVVPEVRIYETAQKAKIYMLETGVVFNGKLSALRFPEHEIVQVKAHKEWHKSKPQHLRFGSR